MHVSDYLIKLSTMSKCTDSLLILAISTIYIALALASTKRR
jgi:hypothetical protein